MKQRTGIRGGRNEGGWEGGSEAAREDGGVLPTADAASGLPRNDARVRVRYLRDGRVRYLRDGTPRQTAQISVY